MPAAHNYAGAPIRRLQMNIFPPQYPDPCAILMYIAYGKSNGFFLSDVISMTMSNFWRGLTPVLITFPPLHADMEAAINAHHREMYNMMPNGPEMAHMYR